MTLCCALSCLCLRARCGDRRGKQESILRRCTADARRCTPMGLSPARGCTVEPERNTLVSRAGAVVHVRSACIGVHPFCICVKPFLGCLRRHAPHRPACQVARRDPASQTRRHPVAQVETAGPSRPDVLPSATPHAQRCGLAGCREAAGERDAACRQNPMHLLFGAARRRRAGADAQARAPAAGAHGVRARRPLGRRRPADGMAAKAHAPVRAGAERSGPAAHTVASMPAAKSLGGRTEPVLGRLTRGPAKTLGGQPSPRGRDAQQNPMHL